MSKWTSETLFECREKEKESSSACCFVNEKLSTLSKFGVASEGEKIFSIHVCVYVCDQGLCGSSWPAALAAVPPQQRRRQQQRFTLQCGSLMCNFPVWRHVLSSVSLTIFTCDNMGDLVGGGGC